MPHQCTHCGELYPDASEELLKGCSCGSRFFYYIKQERVDQIKKEEVKEVITQLSKADKVQIEKDIRELTGLDKEPEKPVILNLESVKVIKPGKFEIDIANLFSKKRPLIYKLEEGKYIIDLAASVKAGKEEIDRKIRDPTDFIETEEKEEEQEESKEELEDVKEEQEEKKEEANEEIEQEEKEEKIEESEGEDEQEDIKESEKKDKKEDG